MNAQFSRTQQKPHVFTGTLVALFILVLLNLALNFNFSHTLPIVASFAHLQTWEVSDTSAPVAVPVPTPPAAQYQIQSTPAAPARVAQVLQPLAVPAPAPSLP